MNRSDEIISLMGEIVGIVYERQMLANEAGVYDYAQIESLVIVGEALSHLPFNPELCAGLLQLTINELTTLETPAEAGVLQRLIQLPLKRSAG